MNASLNLLFQNVYIKTGISFLVVSFLIFAGTMNVYRTNNDLYTSIFFINYLLVFFYFLVTLVKNKQETGRTFRFSNYTQNIILLQLFNISAYALNRSIPVFDISAPWVIGFLLLSNGLLIIHAFRQSYSNTWLSHLIVAVANLGILFHFYESIYVMPVYPYGVIGFWLFGIPLHIFVPPLYLVTFILVVRKFLKKSPQFWATTAITWVVSLGIITYVCFRFQHINQVAAESFHYSQRPYEDASLPAWVKVSQKLSNDWVTERAMKCGIEYADGTTLFSFNGFRLNERIKHDPLVVIASFFSNSLDIPFRDRVKIVRYLFDGRHKTERKLWSGENLSTSDIVTNVQLFPQYRLAYTEKTFKIKNANIGRSRNQQEALYTFYLPEASVVTSAALWVNGEERPAYLTTKAKADSAYKTIVGVEVRDPLLIHWQEGNRVTARIFPCTPTEDSQFKIGVTTPLKKQGDRLVYENIDFEGPYWKGAKESINVVTEGPLENISTPYSFKGDGLNYTYFGRYKSDWYLEFDEVPLAQDYFSFNGKSYQLSPIENKDLPFEAGKVYLNIDRSWDKKTFNALWEAIKDKEVFVFSNNRLASVTESNRKALFRQLRRQRFHLFPFHKIDASDQVLVITKGEKLTPTLSDIKESAFNQTLSTFFKEKDYPVKVYNMGDGLSPYLKTLKEFRSIQLVNGSLDNLLSHLRSGTFPSHEESDARILNQYAGFQMSETIGTPDNSSTAPDHLMRLFIYNKILRKVGKNHFYQKALEEEWIAAAQEAHVLTPVSSLIVLETQKDYDRFDIKKSKNSLQNASIKNSGAVPEPHEWLLIILAIFATIILYLKGSRKAKSSI